MAPKNAWSPPLSNGQDSTAPRNSTLKRLGSAASGNTAKKYRLEQAGRDVTDAEIISDEFFELDPLPSFAAAKPNVWFWVRELIDETADELRKKD